MARIEVISKAPSDLSKKDKSEITTLHQQFFDLKSEEIIGYLKHRSYIDMFYEKNTRKLIGTVGIQWYEYEDYVVAYLGNAVVDKNKHGGGLLTKSILRVIFRTTLKYPTKNKFVIALATSPKAYAYFTKLKHSWPKPYEPVPEKINILIENFLRQEHPDHYQKHEHSFIVCPKTQAVRSKEKKADPGARFQEAWFGCSNEAYADGYQLPCVASISPANVTKVFVSYLNVKKWLPIDRIRKFIIRNNARIREFSYILIIVLLLLMMLYY